MYVYSIEIFPTERFSLYLGLGVVELGMNRCKAPSVYSMVWVTTVIVSMLRREACGSER
jgi:hypothetical protein